MIGGFGRAAAIVSALMVVADATPALAHADVPGGVGFVTGLLHPISGLDHVVAMIAVGLWGAQLGRPAVWLLPVIFPIVMAAGGFLALVGVGLPSVEVGIALSALVLGLMVVLEARPALAVTVAIVGGFAIFHGHAHGTELPDGESALAYSIGFVIATGCLHALGVLLGLANVSPVGRACVRFAGGGVAFAGVVFLVRAVG